MSAAAGLALSTACARPRLEEPVTVALARPAPAPSSPPPPKAPPPSGWVRIEPGVFVMGSPPDELGRAKDETQHEVTMTHAYWMKATEVTWSEWDATMAGAPLTRKCGACPIENVSWYQAAAYCNALSKEKGLAPCYLDGDEEYDAKSATAWKTPSWPAGLACTGYRLPTEAEWEYAARAGTTTAVYTGAVAKTRCEVDANLDKAAWYCGNVVGTLPIEHTADRSTSGGREQPVKGKAPNAWGLYDMIGNVWEWVWDAWEWEADYGSAPQRDPVGPPQGSYRLARGGSWYFPAASCRAAARYGFSAYTPADNLGFRPVKTVP